MTNGRTRSGSILLIFFFVIAGRAVNADSAQKLTTLTVGYSAISYDQLPAWVAKDTGLFVKNGLDVQLGYFTGGTTAAIALVSGDIAIFQNAGPEIVNAHLAGSDPVFVAGGTVTLDWWLMGRPEIKSPAQLKSGAVFNPPTSFIGQKNGFTVLADVASSGLAFQHTSAVTTRKFIRENADAVSKYVKAHVEAIHRLKTDRETGLKVALKYFGKVRDQESMEKAYDRYIRDSQL